MGGYECDRCGAALQSDGVCAYCRSTRVNLAPVAPPPPPTTAQRLLALRESPGYARLADVATLKIPAPQATGCGGVALVAVVCGAMAVFGVVAGADSHSPIPFIWALLPLLMGIGTLVGAGKASSERNRVLACPVEPHAVGVVGVRTEGTGSGKSTASKTLIGLEFEDGARREHAVDPEIVGTVSLVRGGELGVAFLRDGKLVGFRPSPGA